MLIVIVIVIVMWLSWLHEVTQSNNLIRCFVTSLLLFPHHALITNGKRKKLCQVRPVSNNNIVIAQLVLYNARGQVTALV